VKPRRALQGIGNNHAFNQPAGFDAGSFAGLTDSHDVLIAASRIGETVSRCQPGYIATAGASRTQAAESDPKDAIEVPNNGLLTFSPEGRELQPRGSIFERWLGDRLAEVGRIES
jgi:hypothetical protein